MFVFKHLLILTPLFLLGLSGAARAADEPQRYDQFHFQVEQSRPVSNDRMQAVLSITAEDDQAAPLADKINRTMDWAIKTAKSKSMVTARSGGYTTQPVYDKERIRRWRATQELLLESADFAQLGQLTGQLQERLQVTTIHFSVSPERQRAVEDKLTAQALEAFKQRAELIRKQFSAKTYRVVNVSINGGGATPRPLMRTMTMEASPMAVEGGSSILSMQVNGVIELRQ